MNLLELKKEHSKYKLTKFTQDYILSNRKILSKIDQEYYKNMPQLNEILVHDSCKESVDQIMLLRIQQLFDLRKYSNISIDSIDQNADVIILWRQDGLLKEKITEFYNSYFYSNPYNSEVSSQYSRILFNLILIKREMQLENY